MEESQASEFPHGNSTDHQQQDNKQTNVRRSILVAVATVAFIGTIIVFAVPLRGNDESFPDANLADSREPIRIIGGVQSYQNKFPYYVDLGNCGGALIAPKIVITAAHCGRSAYGNKVVVGGWQKGVASGRGQWVTWSKFVVHSGYYENVFFGLVNDFALYHLDEAVTGLYPSLTINQNPSFPRDGTNVVAIGLGIQDKKNGEDGMQTGKYLNDVMIPVINSLECKEELGRNFNPDVMMCAGAIGKGICYHDSGGPLVVRNGNTDILVGVASMIGNHECSKFHKYDNIFARTSAAMPWIKSVVCDQWREQADFCNGNTGGGGCSDSPGWVDPNGYGCSSYSLTEAQGVQVCEILKDQLGSSGLSPVQACCVCKYANPGPSPNTGSTSGGCANYPAWLDPNGYGCDSYELTVAQNVPVCEIFKNQAGTDGLLPSQACCICK